MQKNVIYPHFFANYRWKVFEIAALEAELSAIRHQIDEGLASRETYDPDWEKSLTAELDAAKEYVKRVEALVSSIPETQQLLPCKLFLRLHELSGYNLTETATMMNVSLSTLRRIRDRCADYFNG